jgi:hypothetical protein
MDSPPTRVLPGCTPCTPSRLVRAALCSCFDSVAGPGRRESRLYRIQQFTSGPAFYNALGGLKPGGQLVRPRLRPSFWDRSEPSLLAFALEAEPTIAVLGCDGNRSSEWAPPTLGSSPPIETDLRRYIATRRGAPVDLSSLCRCWRDEPYFPPLARRVEKSPITHRHVLRRHRAPKWVCSTSTLHGGCH